MSMYNQNNNPENNYQNNDTNMVTVDNNFRANNTTTKKSILSRITKRKDKEEESAMIQKNIDSSLKVNPNDVVDPLEMGIKNSLFFRMHVSGLIESASVSYYMESFN